MVAEQWHALQRPAERRLHDEHHMATGVKQRGLREPLQEKEHQECSNDDEYDDELEQLYMKDWNPSILW